MSRVAKRGTLLAAADDRSDIPADAYEQLRRNIEVATAQFSTGLTALMVSKYLGQTTQIEAKKLAERPSWLREVLRSRARGEAVERQLGRHRQHRDCA